MSLTYSDSTHRMEYYDGTRPHILTLSAQPIGGGSWVGIAVVDDVTLPGIAFDTFASRYSNHIAVNRADAPEWMAADVADDPFAVADWIMHRMADIAIRHADSVTA